MKTSHSLNSRSHHRAFWIFATLHLLFWTLIPWLVNPNAPLDVIEGYGWGNEWPIGTYKHPPMQAWLLQIAAIITDRAQWAHFLLSQIATVIAFWAVWQTGRRITNETNALLGVMLLEGIIYFNFTTPEFNPNVLQTCFWALIGWSFHRAIKDNRVADWTLLGIFSAGAIYSKYSALLFLAVLMALLIAHPYSRKRLKERGPYISLTVILLLLLPHLLWLFANNFQPFTYAESRAEQAINMWHRIELTLGFIGSQLLAIGASATMFFVLCKGKFVRARPGTNDSFDFIFLHVITLIPIAVLLTMSLAFGIKIRGMWGASLWGFVGLWAIVNFRHCTDESFLNSFYKIWATVFILTLLVYASDAVTSPAITDKCKRAHFPGKIMAEQMLDLWQKRYNTPLEYAVGDAWVAGNLSFYAPKNEALARPHIFVNGDLSINQWINIEDVNSKGGIIVWCSNHCDNARYANSIPSYLKGLFPEAQLQQPLTIAWQTSYSVSPVVIGWAIVPPSKR